MFFKHISQNMNLCCFLARIFWEMMKMEIFFMGSLKIAHKIFFSAALNMIAKCPICVA